MNILDNRHFAVILATALLIGLLLGWLTGGIR